MADTRIKLTPDFWLYEFLQSETAARLGIDMTPDAIITANLHRLCEDVLQPLRTHIGVGMVISSGWRPPLLNALVRGSKTSQHITGQAADCNAFRMTPLELCTTVVQLGLPFDQVIWEFDSWMHISVSDFGTAPRRHVLTARKVNGQTVYLKGLVGAV